MNRQQVIKSFKIMQDPDCHVRFYFISMTAHYPILA